MDRFSQGAVAEVTMAAKQRLTASRALERFAGAVTNWTGSNSGFASAVAIVIVWAAVGPFFGFSDTWQLVINTGTTIVTFLMVFLIQRAQNKDAIAIHLKLNELVAAMTGASNRLIDVEALSENDLRILQRHYHELAHLAGKEHDMRQSHSIEEARLRHDRKARSYRDTTSKPTTSRPS
jgi:low affinity Fe/Cu permease